MKIVKWLPVLILAAAVQGCRVSGDEDAAATVIAMERAALDRWGKGDPQGYFSIMAPDITYFDPMTKARRDPYADVEDYIKPFTGKIKVDRYEIVDPKVQQYGDVALLSFNLVSYVPGPKGPATGIVKWNSTEVYRRTKDGWRIVHSHWSFTTPELKTPPPNAGM